MPATLYDLQIGPTEIVAGGWLDSTGFDAVIIFCLIALACDYESKTVFLGSRDIPSGQKGKNMHSEDACVGEQKGKLEPVK